MFFQFGSTYVTQTNTNPSTILKFGTWERVKGRVLVGLDENDNDFKTTGKTGGSKTHTLIKDELPPNNFSTVAGTGNAGWGGILATNNSNGVIVNSENFGGSSEAFSILQPYKVVGYMWIRTV